MKQPQTKHACKLSEFLTDEQIAVIRRRQNSPRIKIPLRVRHARRARFQSRNNQRHQAQVEAEQPHLEKTHSPCETGAQSHKKDTFDD